MITNLLITGCSEGLGRALALKFAKERVDVYAVGRQEDKLKELAAQSSYIHPIVADITSAEGRKKILDAVGDKTISIIHNAAIAEPEKLSQINEKSLRQHIETNYIAPMLLTKMFLPNLKQGQRILNITSGAAKMPIAGLLPYCASKAAMQIAMDVLNLELSDKGICCGSISPGLIDTKMGRGLREADVNKLPTRDFYFKAKKENKLIHPSVAADFIAWVLLKADDNSFKASNSNIYDEKLQEKWLGDTSNRPPIPSKL